MTERKKQQNKVVSFSLFKGNLMPRDEVMGLQLMNAGAVEAPAEIQEVAEEATQETTEKKTNRRKPKQEAAEGSGEDDEMKVG